MSRLRRAIDEVDDALLDLIAHRLELAGRTAAPKQRGGQPPRDPIREGAVVRRAATGARKRGVDPEGVRAIFWQLIDLSNAAQGGGTEAL